MTHESESTGARLARLRRAQNITQESLADQLGVSRQAVSKWESDLTYPETDKLLRLSRLYGVTVDYLLTGNAPAGTAVAGTALTDTAPTANAAETAKNTATATGAQPRKTGAQPEADENGFTVFSTFWAKCPRYFEYKSRCTLGALPLVHINIGRGRTATGVIAIGLAARGVVAIGLAAVGVVALGLAAVGVLSVGLAALGLLMAIGSIAVGGLAIGAIAVGLVAIGALAVGQISVGAMAVGGYLAIGDWALGGVSIGKTVADGTWMTRTGSLVLPAAELAQAEALVDAHCPAILRQIARILLRLVCR